MAGLPIFRYRDVLPQLGNLLLRRRLRFRFELLPYEVRDLPPKKIRNLFLAGLNQYFAWPRPFGKPAFAQVEPANFCNLQCPLCLTASQTEGRPRALLSFERYKALVDELEDSLLLVVLWMWGEPFLNPDLLRMIAYSRARGVLTHCSTNGNVPFDHERAAQIVASGLDTLIFGVDGADQETYARYRVGGRLTRVWDNIAAVLAARRALGSPTPRVNLRFVLMRHNEHQVPEIRRVARELGVDFLTFKTVDMPPARGAALDRAYRPNEAGFRRYRYEGDGFERVRAPFECLRPWKRLSMDAHGRVVSCEYDYKALHPFGDTSTHGSLLGAWKGAKAGAFRHHFARGHNDYEFCRGCTYKGMQAEQCNVEMEDLRGGQAATWTGPSSASSS